MLSLKPIPENNASGKMADIYCSIKQTLGSSTVPIIFQYLANFVPYLAYIWQQAEKNLHDVNFQQQSKTIIDFANMAISQIYTPSSATKLFLEKIEDRAEKFELSSFIANISDTNASLYLLSLAIRESLKGAYLGIKQIGERLEEKEKVIFSDLKEGFFRDAEKKGDANYPLQEESSSQIIKRQEPGIVISVFAEFFKFMEWEMEALLKREEYLTRRVELERFALSKLPLLPSPLESSFATVAKKTAQDPNFPELLYLIAELFPTQAPYKLLASAVMKQALMYKADSSVSTSSTSILLPPAETVENPAK